MGFWPLGNNNNNNNNNNGSNFYKRIFEKMILWLVLKLEINSYKSSNIS